MTAQTLVDSLLHWLGSLHLKPTECAQLAVAALLLVCAPFGRRLYWQADALLAQCALGLALLAAPATVVAPQTKGGALDKVHVFLLRGLGAHLLSVGVPRLALRNSNDWGMKTSLMIATILENVFMMVAVGYSTYNMWERKGLHFNQKFPLLYMGVLSISTLGNVIHSVRSATVAHHCQTTRPAVGAPLPPAQAAGEAPCANCACGAGAGGGEPSDGPIAGRNNWIAVSMALDAAALMVVGLLHYAFPLQILKTVIKREHALDGAHACFGRLSAALTLGQAFAAPYVAHYMSRRDAKRYVVGRIMTQVCHFLWNVHGHFQLDVFSMYHVTPFMLSGFFITFLLSVYFRFAEAQAEAAGRGRRPRQYNKANGAGHHSETEADKRLKED